MTSFLDLWAKEEAGVERWKVGRNPVCAGRRSYRFRRSRARNTVKSALACDGPPKYQRAAKGSMADAAEPRIRGVAQVYPRMPATVIAERIGLVVFDPHAECEGGGVTAVVCAAGSASRTSYVAREIAQCDFWFPNVVVPVGYARFAPPPRCRC